jgi:hypothetical protein
MRMQFWLKFPLTVRFRLFSYRIYPFSYYYLFRYRFCYRMSGFRSYLHLKI